MLSQPEVTSDYSELLRLTQFLDSSRNELENLYIKWENLQIEE